jgi:hypothetical protein
MIGWMSCHGPAENLRLPVSEPGLPLDIVHSMSSKSKGNQPYRTVKPGMGTVNKKV